LRRRSVAALTENRLRQEIMMMGQGKFIRKRRKEIGLPPGTPEYSGEIRDRAVEISILDYDADGVREIEGVGIPKIKDFLESPSVSWINVDGIHQADIVADLGAMLHLHPLVIEDILTPDQRPKMEVFNECIFIVLKMLDYDAKKHEVVGEQVSLILAPHVVLCFQERPGDVFDPVRKRIRNGKGRIRSLGCDYLAYALLDTLVDRYFQILEKVGENLEAMEEAVVDNPKQEVLQGIHHQRKEMIFMRKSIWPLREVIANLEREGSALVAESTRRFFRDIYDHTIQIIDTVETFRDMLSGLHDTYLSSLSNRMNETMKVLTIIATIFIPLTFVAGIYGMNFRFMPELGWKWGYPAVWLVLIVLAVGMILFFKKKKWI